MQLTDLPQELVEQIALSNEMCAVLLYKLAATSRALQQFLFVAQPNGAGPRRTFDTIVRRLVATHRRLGGQLGTESIQ